MALWKWGIPQTSVANGWHSDNGRQSSLLLLLDGALEIVNHLSLRLRIDGRQCSLRLLMDGVLKMGVTSTSVADG